MALEVLAALPARSGLLLDLGCGPGALLTRDRGARLGVDRSRSALVELGRVAPTVWRVQADFDAPHLPFPDGSVETCVMLDALPYLEAPRRFLEEVARVVRVGGHFVVSVPNARQLPRLLGLATGDSISLSCLEPAYEPGQRHLFTDRSLRELLERTGFRCQTLLGLLPAPVGSGGRQLAARMARRGLGRAWLAPGVMAVGVRR